MLINSANSKSFRWLLAELSVVILGILIAFQVDEWRIESIERDHELVALESLLLDLGAESNSLTRFLDRANRQVSALGQLTQFGNDEKWDDDSWVSELYREAMLTINYEPSSSTFEGLRSSGNFDIISNQQLLGSMHSHFVPRHNALRILIDDMRDARDEFLLVLGRDIHYMPTSEFDNDSRSLQVEIIRPISDMPRHPDFYAYFGAYAYRISILTVRLQAALDANDVLQDEIRNQISNLES